MDGRRATGVGVQAADERLVRDRSVASLAQPAARLVKLPHATQRPAVAPSQHSQLINQAPSTGALLVSPFAAAGLQATTALGLHRDHIFKRRIERVAKLSQHIIL